MPTAVYAHTLEGHPPADWQPLDEHLQNVAVQAAQFAASFDAADSVRIAGF